MIVITADILLANIFLQNPSKKLSYGKLREYRREIETFFIENKKRLGLKEDVFVEVDKNSLAAAIENYPELFRWRNIPDDPDIIEGADEYYLHNTPTVINNSFNSRLDKRIKQDFLKLIDILDY